MRFELVQLMEKQDLMLPRRLRNFFLFWKVPEL